MIRSIVLLCAVALIAEAMTPEEEACADVILQKIAKEKNGALKKKISKALKLAQANKLDQVEEMKKDMTPQDKEALFTVYFVDECAFVRPMFEDKP